MSKTYCDQRAIPDKIWCKDVLWDTLEEQMAKYKRTRDELSKTGIKLFRPYWELHMPLKGEGEDPLNIMYYVRWFATSDEKEDENE